MVSAYSVSLKISSIFQNGYSIFYIPTIVTDPSSPDLHLHLALSLLFILAVLISV